MLLNEYEIEFMFRKIRNIRNLGNVHMRGLPMRRTDLTSTLSIVLLHHPGLLLNCSFVSFKDDLLDNFGLNIHRIDKDVLRCDRNYPYFNYENLEKLRRIMCT